MTTTYHIQPVPDSLARSPLFTTETIRTDQYGDTHSDKSNPYMPYKSREEAEESLFRPYAWPGGHDVVWVGDGFLLCAVCALKAYREPDEADHEAIHNGELTASVYYIDAEDSAGVICDGCQEYIIQPHCAECGTDTDDDHFIEPLFTHTQYGIVLCAHCLAGMVVRGEAYKTGKREYEVNYQRSTGGTYRS